MAVSDSFGTRRRRRCSFSHRKGGDLNGPPEAPAKSIEALWRLGCEVKNFGVQGVLLKIFEEASMKIIGSPFGRKRYITNLGKLGSVIECCDLEFRYALRRWIRVGASRTLEDIGCGNAVDGVSHHVGRCSRQRNIS